MKKNISLFLIIVIICCFSSGCKNSHDKLSDISEYSSEYYLYEYDNGKSSSPEKSTKGVSGSSDKANESKPVIKNDQQNKTGTSSNGNTTTEKSNIVVEDIPLTDDSESEKVKQIEVVGEDSNFSQMYNNESLSVNDYYQYNTLSNREKEVYNIIFNSILRANNVVKLSKYLLEYNDALTILQKVIADNPEFFWLSKKTSILYDETNQLSYYIFLYYTDGETTDNIDSNYKLTSVADRELILKQIKEFNNKVDAFIKTIPDSFTEIQKEKVIHDYIIKNVYYDNQSALETYTYDDTLPRCFDAYGALCEGKAVCEGYSKIFQYLCYCVGINSTQVTGIVSDGNHMWNAVKIRNEWYQLDTTWDDCLNNNIPYYEYFNFTTNKAMEERNIDSSYLSVPECTSTQESFINAFCCIVSDPSQQPANYKKSADELNVTGEYVIVFLNNTYASKNYIKSYFFNYNSIYKQYLHLCDYKFDLQNSFKKYGNYLYIEISRR